MKFCSSCEQTLSLDEFYNNRRTKDGKQNYCKTCGRERRCSDKKMKKEWTRPEKCKTCAKYEACLDIAVETQGQLFPCELKGEFSDYKEKIWEPDARPSTWGHFFDNPTETPLDKRGEHSLYPYLYMQKDKVGFYTGCYNRSK